jgi:hypothetical protein
MFGEDELSLLPLHADKKAEKRIKAAHIDFFI